MMNYEWAEMGPGSYFGTASNPFKVKVIVGKYTSIGDNLTIAGGQHASVLDPKCVSNYPFQEALQLDYPKGAPGREIIIGNDVWIGANCTICPGAIIGDGSIVGAGSVVRGYIVPYAIAYGNPVTSFKSRFNVTQINYLKQIKWWDWSEDIIKARIKDFHDIDIFISKYA